MPHLSEHVILLMQRCSFPDEAARVFTRVENRLDREADFAAKFDDAVNGYMTEKVGSLGKALDKIRALAKKCGENSYTLEFVFLMNCTEELLRRYRKAGISEDIYWAGMDDLRCKLLECMECEEVCGTFVADWNDGFFRMERFALGRFQFEPVHSELPTFTAACGHVIKKGSPMINFHIPSSGISLTDDVRYDSYKRAYEFFRDFCGEGPMVMRCHSWLLFPGHRKFLPENSNILRFMNDFEIIESKEKDNFGDGWRVFGKDSDLPVEQLPERTALQRAYKQWLCDGNKVGSALGIIVFDGEKILRGV